MQMTPRCPGFVTDNRPGIAARSRMVALGGDGGG